MKLQNIQPIKYNQTGFQAKCNKTFSLKQLTKDVFQKTVSPIKSVNDSSLKITEREIIELYDKAYDFTLTHNPVLQQLKAKKPEINFVDLGESDACYDFFSNTIKFNERYKEDLYAYIAYDEKDTPIDIGITSKDKAEERLLKLKAQATRTEVHKLNLDEKKLYFRSVLIHELRHWTQEHILAHTKGCERHFDYRIGLIKQLIKTYRETIKLCKENGAHRSQTEKYKLDLKQILQNYKYILNLSPERILDENYTLKVSFEPFETRSWSVKEHLLPASMKYRNSDDGEYSKNPIEIDAFNYQADYLMEEKYSNKTKNIREKVFEAMFVSAGARGSYWLENIEQCGYPPLLKD